MVSVVILIVGCTIGGGIIGNALSGWGNNYTAIGLILGLIVGVLISIIGVVFTAAILNIDENLETIKCSTIQKWKHKLWKLFFNKHTKTKK